MQVPGVLGSEATRAACGSLPRPGPSVQLHEAIASGVRSSLVPKLRPARLEAVAGWDLRPSCTGDIVVLGR